MRAFLGQAGYCRPWILGFSEIAKPLVETTKDVSPEPIPWTEELETAFMSMKTALVNAPALGLPDYKKPFKLYVTENRGIAKGVLIQKHGPYERPVAYYSVTLDPVIRGSPYCLRSIAAAAELVEKARNIVLGHYLIVAVPHEVELLLTKYAEKALSAQRTHRYEIILLLTENVKLERSKTLNPATLLPVTEPERSHDCVAVLKTISKTREDLRDTPVEHPDLNLFTDGSSFYLHEWKKMQAVQDKGIWTLNGKPLLPRRYVLPLARWYHEKGHGGPEAVASKVTQLWAAPGIFSAAKKLTEGCSLCKRYGDIRPKVTPGKRPPAVYPFQKLQIDFAEMPAALGYKYLLVIVDQLSGWVEAFPTRKNDSKIVVKILLKEIIPRYGVPEVIDSDRGPHFTASILLQVYVTLDIKGQFHTPYHPLHQGK
ncbi:protein NYNRIN-like [Tyto alba]|uniref:protein NYNRIN-like n=1 Tax=Tyto alba TaxID=56313 RepID=UPI001C6726C7|nr:protein NYNRIN-like [Tyto alba]